MPSCVFKDTVAAITRTYIGIAIIAEALGTTRGGADCAAGGVEILSVESSRVNKLELELEELWQSLC